MKHLASADNLLTATQWQDILATAGIRCALRNRFLGGAVGDLPADQVRPQLWVVDPRDWPRAQALLEELRHPPPAAAGICRGCGETIEGQFHQCWACQAARPG